VVVELYHPRDRNERRIEPAGARRDDDVAPLERVAADFQRTNVDRSIAAALGDHRDAVPEEPRRDDVRTVRKEQPPGRERPGIDDPADQPVSRANRHSAPDAVACSRGKDGETPGAVEGRADDPSDRDGDPLALAQL